MSESIKVLVTKIWLRVVEKKQISDGRKLPEDQPRWEHKWLLSVTLHRWIKFSNYVWTDLIWSSRISLFVCHDYYFINLKLFLVGEKGRAISEDRAISTWKVQLLILVPPM